MGQQSAGALLAACVLLAPHAAGALRPEVESRLRELVEQARIRAEVPALSVAVVAEGEILELATGFADREAGRPATPETLFQAASVTKLLTATLVLRQVERGRLDLDAPANAYTDPSRWIRDGDGSPVDATLRQLLSHTSGLPVSHEGIDASSPDRRPPALGDYLVSRLHATRAPGAKIVYSNDGYALLGYLAARADGQEFEEHARTVLLEPLGMESSSFASPSVLGPRLAAGYGAFFGAFGLRHRVGHADAAAIAPAAALVTTAGDLARFARLHLGRGESDGRRILRAETVAEMTRLHARRHPALDEGYGLGFTVRERAGRRTIWHDGGLEGTTSRLAIAPDHGVAVVVLSNSSDASAVVGLVSRLLDLLAGPEEALAPSPPSVLREVAGAFRLVDGLPPGDWLLNALFNLELEVSDEGATLRPFPILPARPVDPLGPDRFRVHGWYLDGSIARVEGDRLYVGILEARRVARWESARVLLACAGLLGLAVVVAAVLGVRSLVRRVRRPAPAGG